MMEEIVDLMYRLLSVHLRASDLLFSLETSIRMAREKFRRLALKSSWWSCPILGRHRRTWQKSSVRRPGERNWDVRLSVDCMNSTPFTWRWHKVKPAFVCFSAVLFNMHDTDNDGTITLEEYRHVSSGEENLGKWSCTVTLSLWSFSTEFWSCLKILTVKVNYLCVLHVTLWPGLLVVTPAVSSISSNTADWLQ